MSGRRPHLVSRAAAALILLAAGAAGAATLDALRVYALQPACFDYVFTSVSTGSDGAPILAFNHRNGRTFLVRVGERLGDYRVAAYEPKMRRVAVPTTKSEREEKAGRATLEASDGSVLTLDLGRPLAQPGKMAHLVSVATGEWCLVRERDELTLAGEAVVVGAVREDGVTARQGDGEQAIPLISGEEKETLAALWEQRRQQAEAVRKLALQRAEERAAEEEREAAAARAAVPRPALARRTLQPRAGARFVYGTEFRYPTEFELRPAVVDASGRLIQPALIIPRSFQTRMGGISIETY